MCIRDRTLTDFSRLDDWGDLLILTGQVNFDHLLVIISARRGSISYDSSFEARASAKPGMDKAL